MGTKTLSDISIGNGLAQRPCQRQVHGQKSARKGDVRARVALLAESLIVRWLFDWSRLRTEMSPHFVTPFSDAKRLCA